MAEPDDYWTDVRARWSRVVSAVENSGAGHPAGGRVTVAETGRRPTSQIIPVLIAGQRGVGKSALYQALLGDNGYVRRRDEDHVPHRLVLASGRRQAHVTLVVSPGQTAGGDYSSGEVDKWDAMLKPPNYPTGVIYVAAAGYDEPWDPREVNVLEERRQRREAELRRQVEDRLWEQWRASRDATPTDEEERVRAGQIRREVEEAIPSPSEQLWEQNRNVELEHFSRFCQNLLPCWVDNPAAKDLWFILAVSKADLYWNDQLGQVENYYLPGADGEPATEFQRQLVHLIRAFGHRNRPRLAVLPVAGRRQDYRFLPGVGEKQAMFDDMKFAAVQRRLRTTVGEFCGLDS